MKPLPALIHAAFLSAIATAEGSGQESIGHRLRELKALAERNREKFKQEHFETHGRVLTDDVIDAAIQDAHDRAGERWSEYNKPVLIRPIRGLEEYFDGGDDGRRTQEFSAGLVSFSEGVFVSGLSRGWDWNEGRNEFWCVAIPGLDQTTVPEGRTPMTLENCATTSRAAIIVDYTDEPDYELFMKEADGIYSDWCLGCAKAKKGSRIDADVCDITDELQQFFVIKDDDTIRPKVDIDLCVEAEFKKVHYGWPAPDDSSSWWESPTHDHFEGGGSDDNHKPDWKPQEPKKEVKEMLPPPNQKGPWWRSATTDDGNELGLSEAAGPNESGSPENNPFSIVENDSNSSDPIEINSNSSEPTENNSTLRRLLTEDHHNRRDLYEWHPNPDPYVPTPKPQGSHWEPEKAHDGLDLEHYKVTLDLNCCATQIGFGKQPTRRLGNNNGSRNCKGNSDDRKKQVFIYCFRSTVCSGNGGFGCETIESCSV